MTRYATALAAILCSCGLGTDPSQLLQNQEQIDQKRVSCEGLGKEACEKTPGCELDWAVCAAVCNPDGTCPPCDPVYWCRPTIDTPPPPPAPCTGLPLDKCKLSAGCEWRYEPCPLAPCTPDGVCPVCDPYGACYPIDTPPPSDCAGLPERQCNAEPGCLGIYLTECSESRDPPCESRFDRCVDDTAVCGAPGGTYSGGSAGGGTSGGGVATQPPLISTSP